MLRQAQKKLDKIRLYEYNNKQTNNHRIINNTNNNTADYGDDVPQTTANSV